MAPSPVMELADGQFDELMRNKKPRGSPAADPRINRRRFFFFLPRGSAFECSGEKLQQNKAERRSRGRKNTHETRYSINDSRAISRVSPFHEFLQSFYWEAFDVQPRASDRSGRPNRRERMF